MFSVHMHQLLPQNTKVCWDRNKLNRVVLYRLQAPDDSTCLQQCVAHLMRDDVQTLTAFRPWLIGPHERNSCRETRTAPLAALPLAPPPSVSSHQAPVGSFGASWLHSHENNLVRPKSGCMQTLQCLLKHQPRLCDELAIPSIMARLWLRAHSLHI